MHTVRKTLLVGLAALAALVAAAEDTDAAKKDLMQLQGTWTIVSAQRDGHALADDYVCDFKRVTKGDVTTITHKGQLYLKATFTLDPSKNPKTIDYSVTDGQSAGGSLLGIYELHGDTVKYCFANSDFGRPTDFVTKPDDSRSMSVWKREKQ
jgi:uncharacterized protein (TIGR03067 family)